MFYELWNFLGTWLEANWIIFWVMIPFSFVIYLIAFAGWHWPELDGIKGKEYLKLFIILICIIVEAIFMELNNANQSSEDLSTTSLIVLNVLPIFPSALLLYLFGKWNEQIRPLNEMVVILGSMHISCMMVLASLPVTVQIKILANLTYLILPAFFIYQITAPKISDDERDSTG
ncbi:hypothetical protein [Neisseria yangbaofengii]|uniref:hypothetical protein n=1 Tax=Neisseria yangbaofengii TaxID=2709396 RepID=UPI0013E9AC8F|nr:hypothetical protein [Neisseria yangbaofengii]